MGPPGAALLARLEKREVLTDSREVLTDCAEVLTRPLSPQKRILIARLSHSRWHDKGADWRSPPDDDRKAKHSPTNDWDTNAVWVDAGRAVTVTQERHTEPQDRTLY